MFTQFNFMQLLWFQNGWDKPTYIKHWYVVDSVSALQSIKAGTFTNHQDLVYKLLITHSQVKRQGSVISFLWTPAHVGIIGNEKVDKLAKQATKKERLDIEIKLSKSEGKGIEWNKIMFEWQHSWNLQSRHLYSIQNKIDDLTCRESNRKEDVIMSRIRIGDSNLTSMLPLLGKHNQFVWLLPTSRNDNTCTLWMQEIWSRRMRHGISDEECGAIRIKPERHNDQCWRDTRLSTVIWVSCKNWSGKKKEIPRLN